MRSIPEILSSPLALLPSAATALLEKYRLEAMRNFSEIHAPPVQGLMASADNLSRPYDIIAGVAVIPISGVLLQDDPFWFEDATSYRSIAALTAEALGDGEVLGIMYHVDSPGGVVSGCFDLSDALYGMRGEKPTLALVNESCYSAAYALASAADRIVLPRTGGVGSVGVITMHVDITKMLENFGVKVTTIQFGERKSDSYPTTPLSDVARKRLQSDVDKMGEMFVSLVARNRGISESAVRETEAGCFLGEEGVKVGFADAVMPAEQALSEFIELVNK